MPTTLSPLRYPGGKTKLYTIIQPIVNSCQFGNEKIYVEPFAGGSGLALKLLFNHDVDRIILNDIDFRIYCFWHSILTQTTEFINMIVNCQINIDTWYIEKNIYSSPDDYSELEVGFATFFLNRCNVSGVLLAGPIGGYAQLGKYKIGARFNKIDLINKISEIGANADNIEFYNMDAIQFIQTQLIHINNDNIFLNIDPPYVKKGELLYENSFSETDHAALCLLVKRLDYKWVVTYDKCELIENLYENYQMVELSLQYSAGNNRIGKELLIFSNMIEFEA
ncbi:MAG: DNA adenine methylase [Anaerolineaceae bacterium]|nr:DNA adenine methylase [Anaerolineaceae bacterium]